MLTPIQMLMWVVLILELVLREKLLLVLMRETVMMMTVKMKLIGGRSATRADAQPPRLGREAFPSHSALVSPPPARSLSPGPSPSPSLSPSPSCFLSPSGSRSRSPLSLALPPSRSSPFLAHTLAPSLSSCLSPSRSLSPRSPSLLPSLSPSLSHSPSPPLFLSSSRSPSRSLSPPRSLSRSYSLPPPGAGWWRKGLDCMVEGESPPKGRVKPRGWGKLRRQMTSATNLGPRGRGNWMKRRTAASRRRGDVAHRVERAALSEGDWGRVGIRAGVGARKRGRGGHPQRDPPRSQLSLPTGAAGERGSRHVVGADAGGRLGDGPGAIQNSLWGPPLRHRARLRTGWERRNREPPVAGARHRGGESGGVQFGGEGRNRSPRLPWEGALG